METPTPKILVFSTEKISDPALDLAGLLKLHYSPTVHTIVLPCSSAVRPGWILHAFEKGFAGVFIAADGSDCPYGESCIEKTSKIVEKAHVLMREKGIPTERLKMAAVCSVCAELFVNQMKLFAGELSGERINE
ncbi:MAG: hydrogenase iron-sulfur subunit [Bacteroidetes bacterium]|nr:MAG: hydrogenase iron-sulfur subunit [Bacteroidota bacterium]